MQILGLALGEKQILVFLIRYQHEIVALRVEANARTLCECFLRRSGILIGRVYPSTNASARFSVEKKGKETKEIW